MEQHPAPSSRSLPSRFDMALKNETALLFVLLLLSALALSSGALVLSVLVRK